MKKMRISLLIVLSLMSAYGFSQTLIHLHSNKQTYTTGEKVWLSAYLSDSVSGKLLTQTHPLYLQLFDSDGVLKTSEILYTNKGRGFGYLPINRDLSGGVYRIRAFTKSMFELGRQYEKKIIIQSLKDSTIAFWNESTLPEVRTEKPLKISILPTKYVFDKRERVEILVKVADSEGRPQQGTFSLSVSDLRNAGGQDGKTLLQDFSQLNESFTPAETPEKLRYGGKVVHEKSDEDFKNVELIVMGLDSAKHFTRVVQTDSSGSFQINDLQIEGEQSVNYQVNNRREKSIQNAVVKWDNFPEQQKIPAIHFEELAIDVAQKALIAQNIKRPDGEREANWEGGIVLSEVQVVGVKEDDLNTTGMIRLHTDYNFKMDFDPEKPLNMSLMDMIRMLPGVYGFGNSVIVRGIGTINSNTPLFLIDGMAFIDPSAVINSNDVIRIEVLSGANAAIYGSSGGNGVIAIYTRRFKKIDLSKIKSQTKSDKLKGYQIDKFFYSPNYSDPTEAGNSDNRLTLYWNPEVITNENGEAWINFYTSDVVSNFQIMAEGVTNSGVGVAFKMIRVK